MKTGVDLNMALDTAIDCLKEENENTLNKMIDCINSEESNPFKEFIGIIRDNRENNSLPDGTYLYELMNKSVTFFKDLEDKEVFEKIHEYILTRDFNPIREFCMAICQCAFDCKKLENSK